ncbi:MAG: ABC transporter ATP-binding protein, partial [Oscillospiraceae bacterium]|nr:ABC transporter ATP-binding protein [Oscillospiraceae bacterium]
VCDHVGIMDRGSVLLERSLSELQENLVKIQAVFPEGDTQLPRELEILHRSNVGRVQTLIVRGNAEYVINHLSACAPLMLEALPLSLEEIFIYELGGVDHAVRNVIV